MLRTVCHSSIRGTNLSVITLKLISLKLLEYDLLDSKFVRKCKLDGRVCPQVAFLQAYLFSK